MSAACLLKREENRNLRLDVNTGLKHSADPRFRLSGGSRKNLSKREGGVGHSTSRHFVAQRLLSFSSRRTRCASTSKYLLRFMRVPDLAASTRHMTRNSALCEDRLDLISSREKKRIKEPILAEMSTGGGRQGGQAILDLWCLQGPSATTFGPQFSHNRTRVHQVCVNICASKCFSWFQSLHTFS